MAFNKTIKVYILSGIYVIRLLHNIKNYKKDFMLPFNLFLVDEKSNIL